MKTLQSKLGQTDFPKIWSGKNLVDSVPDFYGKMGIVKLRAYIQRLFTDEGNGVERI